MNDLFILLPIVLPIAAAIPLGVFDMRPAVRNTLVGGVTGVNLILVIIIANTRTGAKLPLLRLFDMPEIALSVDKLGILFSLMVSVLWLVTAVYAMEYVKHIGREKRFMKGP